MATAGHTHVGGQWNRVSHAELPEGPLPRSHCGADGHGLYAAEGWLWASEYRDARVPLPRLWRLAPDVQEVLAKQSRNVKNGGHELR
ncbi:hypothetical protein FRIGORI9N_40069 [Frigoribacterium sp. 9N]|nr:hypothetical protein FRIGORI9N_40069 [Frigoribacterium sp. 9N]